jgi:hypothetical protein
VVVADADPRRRAVHRNRCDVLVLGGSTVNAAAILGCVGLLLSLVMVIDGFLP